MRLNVVMIKPPGCVERHGASIEAGERTLIRAAFLWQATTHSTEDEIRSVEGRDAGRGGPEGTAPDSTPSVSRQPHMAGQKGLFKPGKSEVILAVRIPRQVERQPESVAVDAIRVQQ